MMQPKTGKSCNCKPGRQRDNCPTCEGTGMVIDFRQIREARASRYTADQYVRDAVTVVVEDWFTKQVKMPWVHFYLWYRKDRNDQTIGKPLVVAEDQPAGYFLASIDALSRWLTKDQQRSWIYERVRKLPILPDRLLS